MSEGNGLEKFRISISEWKDLTDKVDDMHEIAIRSIPLLTSRLENLEKLDTIAISSRATADSNARIENNLISRVGGDNRVDPEAYRSVIKTLCFCLGAIIIWFTGLQPHLEQIFGFFK